MYAQHPLVNDDRLGKLPIPVSFFYGDIDWMPKEGCDYIIDNNPFKGTQSKFYELNSSDHHMYFDNPSEFAFLIISDLKTLETDTEK